MIEIFSKIYFALKFEIIVPWMTMTGVVHEISGFYNNFTILGFPGAIVNIFSLYTKTTRKVHGFKKK